MLSGRSSGNGWSASPGMLNGVPSWKQPLAWATANRPWASRSRLTCNSDSPQPNGRKAVVRLRISASAQRSCC